MKTRSLLPLPLSLSCAALLASSVLAVATDYEVQSINVGNGSAVTVLKPVERQATVAVYVNRHVRNRPAAMNQAAPAQTTVQHAPSGDGGPVTFEAPSQ
jgi:hypothetical protein